MLAGVNLQIKLTKARSSFYLMNVIANSKTTFKFLDAKLFVKRIRPHPDFLSAHNDTLKDCAIARYKLTSVELKSFTFAPGSYSLSIDTSFWTHPQTYLVYHEEYRFSRLYGD
jgi:hypothetical protein